MKTKHGAAFSPAADIIDFRGFTDPLILPKDWRDQNGLTLERVLTTTASSELEDRMGDRMMPSMLQAMAKSFQPGSAIFRDHSYSADEDVIGMSLQFPQLAIDTATADGANVRAGQQYMVMRFAYQIHDNSPPGMRILGFIERGTRMGTSVGVEVKDFDVRSDADGYALGLDLTDGELIEVSTVGVPANRESYHDLPSRSFSWTERAVKGLRKRYGADLDMRTDTDFLYTAKNWRDFDELDQIVLRHIDGILEPYGLAVARKVARRLEVGNVPTGN